MIDEDTASHQNHLSGKDVNTHKAVTKAYVFTHKTLSISYNEDRVSSIIFVFFIIF